MSDERFSYEDLPWLQSVVDEEEPRGVSARKMLAALGVVVLAAVLIGAVFFLIGRSDSDVNAPPELIKADPAPYKVRPANPGGLDIAGESETAFETSAGQDTDSRLDLSKMHQEEGAAPPPAEPAKPTTAPEAKQPEVAPQRKRRPRLHRRRPAAPAASFSSAPSRTSPRPSGRGRPCRPASPRSLRSTR